TKTCTSRYWLLTTGYFCLVHHSENETPAHRLGRVRSVRVPSDGTVHELSGRSFGRARRRDPHDVPLAPHLHTARGPRQPRRRHILRTARGRLAKDSPNAWINPRPCRAPPTPRGLLHGAGPSGPSQTIHSARDHHPRRR